jgi:aspartyl-tRNA(Asn)/glutamyl-tRNA(Gln) amidotransferase subunit A
MTLSWTLDKVGVLARSAQDLGLVLDAIARAPGRGRPDFHAATSVAPESNVRIAIGPSEIDEAAPSIRNALARGLDTMRRLFPNAVEIEIDRSLPFIPALEDIVRVEGAYGLRDHLRRDDFQMSDERQLRTLRSGLDVPAVEYLAAVRGTVDGARRAFDAVFRRANVILSASRTDIAPRLDIERPPRDATKLSDLLRAAGNLAGVPGVSFPCGLSDEGLPVGLQIIGPRGSDGLLLAVAAAFQRHTNDHEGRPPDPA